MAEEKSKGLKIVMCAVILIAGMLIGAVVKDASPIANGVILLITLGVVTAVWKA